MVEKDRFLVVVSVLEGRNFPKRPRHELVAEARFDGELLATDAVPHGEGPDFTQELAWELDKRGLHQHRLQRTSIKVQVYAVDTQSTMREPIGYVVMDLRSAQDKQIPKWYQLLHTKYHKQRPEIKLSIYIDDDKGAVDTSFKAKPAPARDSGKAYDAKVLQPMLNELEGYYQIGPAEHCRETFMLSVTVAFAANLPQLIPTSLALPPSGYFFYYSLLGNDVTNEVFHDLLNPSFPAERASVKVRSSLKALRQFFGSQPGIELHLCCGDQSLGSCEVSLAPLLKEGSTEIYMKPVTVEGAFVLTPPNKSKSVIAPITETDLQPAVGVSVVLRKEEQSSKPNTPVKPPKETTEPSQPTQSPPKTNKSSPPQKSKSKAKPKSEADKQKVEVRKSPPLSAVNDGSYSETFESAKSESQAGSLKEDEEEAAATGGARSKTSRSPSDVHVSPRRDPSSDLPLPAQIQQAIEAQEPPAQYNGYDGGAPTPALPAQAHHFSVSLDLRSVRHLNTTANVFLRYTYPFFGSPAPILTHPPVEVRPGTEVLLPQGFCAFDFATSTQQIRDTFQRVPLLLEVWSSTESGDNVLLGAAQLPLTNVMGCEKARAVHTSGCQGWRQVWSERLPIHNTANPGSSQKSGELHVVLSMEDWGPIDQQRILQQQQQRPTTPSPPPVPPAQEPRETQEYRVAMELEMWKEQQEAKFEAQLKQREVEHMASLAEEWKRRDKEREVVVKKKMIEYQILEEQLRKTLTDLEKRDKQLAANEQEVLRLRTDLEREHERKMTEMREASHRLKEDCDHTIHLEKIKIKEYEEYVAKLKGNISEEEAKYKHLEGEFARYKEQQNSKPEVRLQSEINLLTLEKVELDRKLDAVTKSKVHYKQQWGRALKELARLKQKEQATAKAQLRKQQQELEHMRLRYLAAEEKEVVSAERKQLEEIKNELNMLRDSELKSNESKNTSGGGVYAGGGLYAGGGMSSELAGADDAGEEHVTRLIEERDSLLRTGVYTSEDPIIAELDRQIREAIAIAGREKEKQRIISYYSSPTHAL